MPGVESSRPVKVFWDPVQRAHTPQFFLVRGAGAQGWCAALVQEAGYAVSVPGIVLEQFLTGFQNTR